MLVGVLDHHHRRIDHGADGDGDAAERHDVGVEPLDPHDQEGGQHPERQGEDGHQGRTAVPEEQAADHADDNELLDQLLAEVGNGPVDQLRAVVGGDHLDAGRQAAFQLGQLGLHRRDGLAGVLARPQDHHPAGHLALAVQFGDAAPHFWAHLKGGDVSQPHRHAAGSGADWHGAEVVELGEVAVGADHVFGLAQLQHRTAGLLVGTLDRFDDLTVGDAVGGELHRVEHHLVLTNHAADAGHLGDAGQALEFVAQEPVLQAAQLRQVVLSAAVDQGVFVDPADARGVRPQRRLGGGGQAALHLVEIFQHPRPGPVEVGSVLEQHIDEAVAEEGIAAHGLGARHRQHGGGQGIGDLVLDDLRRLAGIGGADHHLYVGEVGQGVDRRRPHRPEAGGKQGQRRQQDEEPPPD